MLPKGSAEPGRFRPERAPWVIPITEACINPEYKTVVAVMGSQMSKTDGVQLTLMGYRLDDDPVPLLYIGPTKSFVEKVIEPRINSMVSQAESLRNKCADGRTQKTQKNISGVKLRLAWAHSATELAGDPAGLVLLDERDRMPNDIAGEGDPKELADARHSTYSDGTTVVTSTPTIGTAETYLDEHGIERWELPEEFEDIHSPTWQLFLEGTRHEWAWPCPECGEYFVPRLRNLIWPKESTPARALVEAKLQCPNCEHHIDDTKKRGMNDRGRMVAPGQQVHRDGTVTGEPPAGDTYSSWTSGLCSPWRSFGSRASAFLKAVLSGDSERIQGVINTQFGELYRLKGDAPKWEIVKEHAADYRPGFVHTWVQLITITVDVQINRLVYVVRGWGVDRDGEKSALIEYGELHGDPQKRSVWDSLANYKSKTYGPLEQTINRCFVDSGYLANAVYTFCRKHNGWAYPTKGQAQQTKPLNVSSVDVKHNGRVERNGLQLWNIDTNYFKTWVHDRVRSDEPRWLLPDDITDDYCKQIVAESKAVKPSGGIVWLRVSKDNHYLDCESMAYACAKSLKIDSLLPIEEKITVTEEVQAEDYGEDWIGSGDDWIK